MNFSEFYKSNPLFCLINFVLIQHILLMVQVRNNFSWKLIFFHIHNFSSHHLLSTSMKSCYFSATHLTICLIVWLNMQRQIKVGQWELTSTHAQNNIWISRELGSFHYFLLSATFHIIGTPYI